MPREYRRTKCSRGDQQPVAVQKQKSSDPEISFSFCDFSYCGRPAKIPYPRMQRFAAIGHPVVTDDANMPMAQFAPATVEHAHPT